MPVLHYVSLIDECSWVITPLLAVFELVLFMIVPRDLPIHYHAFYVFQKVHFIITLISLWRLAPRITVISRLQCIWQIETVSVGFLLLYWHFTICSYRRPGSLAITAGKSTYVRSSSHTGLNFSVMFGEFCSPLFFVVWCKIVQSV